MKLFRDCGTTDNVAALQYECSQAGFAEIACRGQAVMACADHNGVEIMTH